MTLREVDGELHLTTLLVSYSEEEGGRPGREGAAAAGGVGGGQWKSVSI